MWALQFMLSGLFCGSLHPFQGLAFFEALVPLKHLSCWNFWQLLAILYSHRPAFSFRGMPSSPKGLNTATPSIPKLLVPQCWFPCPFPNPVSTCSYLGASFLYGTGKNETFQSFLHHYHWAVFTYPPEESCFPELSFSLTIPIGYFLVVIYVQQNKSSLVLSVSDAFILLLCFLLVFICSTLVILQKESILSLTVWISTFQITVKGRGENVFRICFVNGTLCGLVFLYGLSIIKQIVTM